MIICTTRYNFTMFRKSDSNIEPCLQQGTETSIYYRTISDFAVAHNDQIPSVHVAVVCSDNTELFKCLSRRHQEAVLRNPVLDNGDNPSYIPEEVINNSALNETLKGKIVTYQLQHPHANEKQSIRLDLSKSICMGDFRFGDTASGIINDFLHFHVMLPLLCYLLPNTINSTQIQTISEHLVEGREINDDLLDLWKGINTSIENCNRTLETYGKLDANALSALPKDFLANMKSEVKAATDKLTELQKIPKHLAVILNFPSRLFSHLCTMVQNGAYPHIDRIIWIKSPADFAMELAGRAVTEKQAAEAKGVTSSESFAQKLQDTQDALTNNMKDIYLDDLVVSWVKELPDFAGLNLDNLKIHIDKDITSTRSNTNENRTHIKSSLNPPVR